MYQMNKKLYPWLCWFLASSFIFYKYVLQVSPSIMIPDLMREFNLSATAMGNLSACFFYPYFFMQLPAGILLDRYNPRYLLTLSVVVCASGALLFAHASNLLDAQIGRALIGLGGAFSAVGTMKIISLWFEPKQFALVSGLMMTMAMLGAISGEAPLSYLMANMGWRGAIQLCALIGFALAMVILMALKKPPTQHASSDVTSVELFKELKKLLSFKRNWIISLYSGLAFAPIEAFAGLWGVPFFIEKYGLNQHHAAALISVTFVGFAIGAPFSGWLSDKIALRKPIMIVGTAISLVTLALIIYINLSYSILIACISLFGFFSGFFFVSFATIRESNPHHLSGSSIGFINMFDALVGALAEPAIGKLLDLQWQGQSLEGARFFSLHSYQVAFSLLIAGLLVALICQCFIKETHCQPY